MHEFEKYSERARRVILYARYEAGGFGSPQIESEHLLLGLMAEDWELVHGFLGRRGSLQSTREMIKTRILIRQRISTSMAIPFSQECTNILKYAEEEAIQRKESRVDSVHLLLGILRSESCTAARIFREPIVDDFATSTETVIQTSAPQEEVDVPRMVTDLIDAFDASDAKHFSLFFDDVGQVIDVQGELWVGRSDIEKMAPSHLFSLTSPESRGQIQEIRFVGRDSAVASIVWEKQDESQVRGPVLFSMTVVLHHKQKSWRVAKAHVSNE